MFKSIKSRVFLAIELIMPWLTLIGGIPAIYYWQKTIEEWRKEYNSEAYFHASDMLELFYDIAMTIGVVVIIAEIVIGAASFILMILAIFKKNRCVVLTRLILAICSGVCVFGTAILMFLIIGFTYGQGI